MAEAPGFVSVTIMDDVLTLDFWDVNHRNRLHSISKKSSNKK